MVGHAVAIVVRPQECIDDETRHCRRRRQLTCLLDVAATGRGDLVEEGSSLLLVADLNHVNREVVPERRFQCLGRGHFLLAHVEAVADDHHGGRHAMVAHVGARGVKRKVEGAGAVCALVAGNPVTKGRPDVVSELDDGHGLALALAQSAAKGPKAGLVLQGRNGLIETDQQIFRDPQLPFAVRPVRHRKRTVGDDHELVHLPNVFAGVDGTGLEGQGLFGRGASLRKQCRGEDHYAIRYGSFHDSLSWFNLCRISEQPKIRGIRPGTPIPHPSPLAECRAVCHSRYRFATYLVSIVFLSHGDCGCPRRWIMWSLR